jgi:hypothetical protein
MNKGILLVLFFGMLFTACDKKVLDYSKINLEDTEGKERAVSSLKGRFIVLTFLSPECPLSENYTLTLKNLQSEFIDKEVFFYSIFPGTFYPKPQIIQFLKKYDLSLSSSFFDPSYRLRDYCKATTTPEVFIIDQLGQILYQGAIDNWAITLGKQRQVISEHYLRDALIELLDDKKVTISKTRAVGCIIE